MPRSWRGFGVWVLRIGLIWRGGIDADGVGCFSLGLGVAFVDRFVFEDVDEAGAGEDVGIGRDELVAVGTDFEDAFLCEFEIFGSEEVAELGEGDLVESAEVERGDRWVDEVFEEECGELGKRRSRLGIGRWIGGELIDTELTFECELCDHWVWFEVCCLLCAH